MTLNGVDECITNPHVPAIHVVRDVTHLATDEPSTPQMSEDLLEADGAECLEEVSVFGPKRSDVVERAVGKSVRDGTARTVADQEDGPVPLIRNVTPSSSPKSPNQVLTERQFLALAGPRIPDARRS